MQRLHRLADTDEPGEQGGMRKENKKRKSKITQEKRQPSEQAPDLAMGFDALDVEHLTGQGGLQSLEDQDYFVVQLHQGSSGNEYGYGYGCDGGDGYDYMMESPPQFQFLQDLEDAIIPRAGSLGHGHDPYGYEDYGSNDGNMDDGPQGRSTATREQIVVRHRKRPRALCVDDELVDPDMLSMNASQQQQQQSRREKRGDVLPRGALGIRTPEAREGRLGLASFPAVPLRGEGTSGHKAEYALGSILGELFVRRSKRGKVRGGQSGAGDLDGSSHPVGEDAQTARLARQDMGQDFYDGNGMEQGVELEQLRTALHLTPQNLNSFRFGPGGYYSSNPTSSLPGSVRSSVDLSREDSGLTSSVQKEKLSDLLLESQYDLQENRAGPDSGRRPSGRSGRRDVHTWSQLDRFKLQETCVVDTLEFPAWSRNFTHTSLACHSFARGPSEPQDKMDELAFGGSHTLDILTKAMLCCRSWGAFPADPAHNIDDKNDAGVGCMDVMSLDDVTRHLSRQEAAKMFHHVLVGVTAGIVTASQGEPYEPILIQFN